MLYSEKCTNTAGCLILLKNRVLILGGYGNFGRRIALALVKANIPITIAGRNNAKADLLIKKILRDYPKAVVNTIILNIHSELSKRLIEYSPKVVINTCGPFQFCNYSVAESCIRSKVHYIDLSDGREFVTGIRKLNTQAKTAGVMVISGASTVPGLSSAVLEKFKDEFSEIDSMKYGISPGQKANRGLATTKAIMSYVGKRIKPFAGHHKAYGWQDIYQQEYPELGRRWMANCEIPDLDLFPEKYAIKSIQFSAGMELSFMHLGLWLMSWIVRLGIPLKLSHRSQFLLTLSNLFNVFGSPDGGMHIIIKGKDKRGKSKEIKWFVIAKNGDGPQIPTIPAIILAKKLYFEDLTESGAVPCVGLVSLQAYKNELSDFEIHYYCE